jgi:short-subunit dehydrogenase involved in D-alanine esterification of teichoic acids
MTSGLSFLPLAGVSIYCATKAALHSYTLSLRQQLKVNEFADDVMGKTSSSTPSSSG